MPALFLRPVDRRQLPGPIGVDGPILDSPPLLDVEIDIDSEDEEDEEEEEKLELSGIGQAPTPTTTILIGPTTVTVRVSILAQPSVPAIPNPSPSLSSSTTTTTTTTEQEPSSSVEPSSSTVVVVNTDTTTTPSPPSPSSPPTVNNSPPSLVFSSLSPSASPSPSVIISGSNAGTLLSEGNGPQASGNLGRSNNGLSTGAIVGIVLSIVFILLLASAFLIRKTLLKRRRRGGVQEIDWPAEKSFGERFVASPTPSGQTIGGSGRARGTITPYPFTAPTNVMASSRPPITIPRVPPPPLVTTPPPVPTYYNAAPPSQRPPTQITGSLPQPQTRVDTYTVKSTFIPTLPDEMNIVAGDKVRVLSTFDDGWALCERNGERGMVPLECIVTNEPFPSSG